mmetsp:Transcript_29049/g.50129  ORF Transcript_29049/g.50129 Transcript_29049/m.50129 type:complete len:125 (+) Transcript_29049:100-474(+)|eukprot:CAMPEP_0205916762 /NCGR_PEP_ID=MMETSP1325-20131115/8727_1 /ASSEMBLY_ACC=CAM_ASM_000708 /TAXON_ID=236786 /ORGANISM="Florenciella sp., Strain RCC1007" /LENGTH=124 /DNA_ID=CAMNT_0053284089 /DNA_START=35 /DNA_END=409 /DNA_ORIENTATION=+
MATAASKTPTYQIRPEYRQRISVNEMKGIINKVLKEELEGKQYQTEQVQEQTKKIADDIRNKLREMDKPRYKFFVQVVIGEQRGEGVRMGCRTFWDADTDSYASEQYVNDSLFCVATAYGVYLY